MKELLDIYSPMKGKVKYALPAGTSAYGNRVYITYDTCILMFAHLDEFFVKVGQEVSAGELIGKMGNTGYSPSTHLHVSAFNLRARKLTASYTVDPTYILELADYYCVNTLCSNGFGSKYCNPKLVSHEGIDFSGIHAIDNYQGTINPLTQDYRVKANYPGDYA